MLGALLHWRPKSFLDSIAKAVPATAVILIQFPLYGSIAAMLAPAKGFNGHSLADQVAHAFVSLASAAPFPPRPHNSDVVSILHSGTIL
jgi:short-chain fatty acids transporter